MRRIIEILHDPDIRYEIEDEKIIFCYKEETLLFAGLLLKENNRGWTIQTYALTGNRHQIFLSRGLWTER